MAWTMAAIGSARNAPTMPAMLAPAMAHPKAIAGCISMVRAVMRGLRR